MVTKNQKKQALVPELRFPDFTEEWTIELMGNLYSYIPTNSLSRDKMNSNKGEVRNIHYGDIHTKLPALLNLKVSDLPRINASESLVKYKDRSYCKEGDMIFADASEDLDDIGKCIEIIDTNKLRVLSGLHTIHARQKKSRLIVGFGGHLFHSKGLRSQIQRESQGAKVLGISPTRLSEVNVYFPRSEAEQQKIAACLGSLDDLIAAHSRKLAALQDHKKGLLQQLFPAEGETTPKLRFPEFEGEWQEKPLKKLATYQNGKAYEKHILDDGKYVVVNSRFVSTESMVQKFTNEEFCPAKKGDVLMVLSDLPKGRALAKCFFVEEDKKYGVNQRVARLRSKDIHEKFLFYRLNRHSRLLAYDDGITQTHLSKSDVEDCLLAVPDTEEEQQKIADCLSALDALITAQTEQIAALKEHKKGLMQKLFPAENASAK